MPAIQSLKKQLRLIGSTKKLTKAMKTISTVKFSKLNEIYTNFSEYGKQCERIFCQYGGFLSDSLAAANSDAPGLVIVIAGNKGLCGGFNTEILKFAKETLSKKESYLLAACGKKAIGFFKSKNIPLYIEHVFNDVPTFEECGALLEEIISLRKEGKISDVSVIYPKYSNMMKQKPEICELFTHESEEETESVQFFPDKETITQKTAINIFKARFFELVLESAIGTQAATLITMRAAYDTAEELYNKLEREINRLRQSAVTSDIIATTENHN